MRSSIGLLLVPVLGFGGCAEGTDTFIPQIPQGPDVAIADEPLTESLENTSQPLERPDTVSLEGVTTSDTVTFGRAARARYDRLRAAGLVR